MTHNWKIKKQNFFLFAKKKISRQINEIRDTGPDTENTDHAPIWVLKSHIITDFIKGTASLLPALPFFL
jgi:hypothetical protein